MNPFLHPYQTPFDSVPFSRIKNTHFLPAIKKGIEIAHQEIQAIITNNEEPNFENTIVALEHSGELIGNVSAVFFNLNSANTSDELQAIAQQISPLLIAYKNSVLTNEKLFERIKKVHDKGFDELSSEETILVQNNYKQFVRNGANLNSGDQKKLRDIDTQLAKLSLTFGENVLKDSNAFKLVLEHEEELSGLPLSVIESAKEIALDQGLKDQWIFTLDYPSYIPFISYSNRRSLRQKMYAAFHSKGFQDNENNNEQIVKDIVRLRAKRAQLIGYKSHAHYILEERMAESPMNVFNFLNTIEAKAAPFAKQEFTELTDYAHKLDGIAQLEKWDANYYAEKLKKERFNIDDELLRPYFPLQQVIDGVFQTAQKLFGISFHVRDDVEVYHNDVITYEVRDQNNNHLALFYGDFFPRTGKRQGAWMTSFRSQQIRQNKDERPHVSIVCNFTKPSKNKPSLLSFQEVTTLFHEFGHALHGIFAQGTYASLSGTSVFWDFVELPSQLMENWCYEKECLNLFAQHYSTGEQIPLDYIDKIKKSSNFMAGLATIRQVGLGKVDLGWHALTHQENLFEDDNLVQFEKKHLGEADMYPPVPNTCISTAFSHIFQGGYSSGYYSYKWAEVLDADAFEAFNEAGIFNSQVAHKFRDTVLSKGGSIHPSELYRQFRGKDPQIEALFKRAGLSSTSNN